LSTKDKTGDIGRGGEGKVAENLGRGNGEKKAAERGNRKKDPACC